MRTTLFRFTGLVMALLLGAGIGSVQAAPPSDEAVDAIANEMNEWVQFNRGNRDRSAAVTMANELAAELAFDELTFDQITKLYMLMQISSDIAEKGDDRLAALAEVEDVDGAAAAAMRFQLKFGSVSSEETEALLRVALAHPRCAAAYAKGSNQVLMQYLGYVSGSVLANLNEELVAANEMFQPDLDPKRIAMGGAYVKTLQSLYEDIDAETRETIRLRLLGMTETAHAAAGEDEKLAMSLQKSIDLLKSPIGMGTFFNNTSPELSFIWSSGDTTFSKLSELKGKVVVLDFWATWCGPCIRSFPDVAKLQARYADYDVQILGVTSLQGYHITKEREKIDTKDDPEKEFALMAGIMPMHGMTWPVAFAEQDVYNPDYGVSGIPHVAIIDAKGNVRYNGLHPSSEVTPFSEKTSKIDKLLKEAGLEAPEPYVEHEEEGS